VFFRHHASNFPAPAPKRKPRPVRARFLAFSASSEPIIKID
jgi:hypothetical protein